MIKNLHSSSITNEALVGVHIFSFNYKKANFLLSAWMFLFVKSSIKCFLNSSNFQ